MNIQSITPASYNNQNNSRPTFGAIHPCQYFIKRGENTYELVSDAELIKNNLQRKLITWLNHNYNNRIKAANGSYAKSKPETPQTKALRERLVRYFSKRDTDYSTAGQDRAASYFNTDNSTGLIRAYIFTGRSVNILDQLAQGIKNVQHQIKTLTSDIQEFYRTSYIDAKTKATKEIEPELNKAKSKYHETILNMLRAPETKSDIKNTQFNAIFEEKTKGKKKTYELVDARFEQRLL